MLTIDKSWVYSLDMLMPFRSITHREGMILRCQDRYREWSPFVEYGDQEASRWLKAALEDESDYARYRRLRTEVGINVTVPITTPQRAYELVGLSKAQVAKVKVADPRTDLNDDLIRLQAVREALGKDGYIRIDANGAWTPSQALDALRLFAPIGLDYVEQPCATVEELADLKERLGDLDVRIAADESIRKAEDPYRVAALGAADVVILKVQPLGGIASCCAIQEQIGLSGVISSALESSVGISRGIEAALRIPSLDGACGLGTVSLFSEDVASSPLIPVEGKIEGKRVEDYCMIGRHIDSDRLISHMASPERQQWWNRRLERCLEIVSQWEKERL